MSSGLFHDRSQGTSKETPAQAGGMRPLFIAVDGGAREALAPVAAHCGCALEDTAADAAEGDRWWAECYASRRPDLLVAGTSDSVRGRRVESAARRAARHARVPVSAIEDFPGNYYEVPGGEPSLVLVESAAARALCLSRFGDRTPRVEVAIPARYDPYRAQLIDARRRTGERWTAQTHGASVLWAGQPETADSVHTLEALLPVLREHAVELLFKAHPRDPGYAEGAYGRLLDASGVAVSDVTSLTVEAALARAPRLIATQFSSIAIEAGFFGVPSLWVLLAGAGGASLRRKKGYAVPPLCLARGAAYVADTLSVAPVFAQALGDLSYRANLMRCFDDYYSVHELGAAQTMGLLVEAAEPK
jgi:hypothetical protein